LKRVWPGIPNAVLVCAGSRFCFCVLNAEAASDPFLGVEEGQVHGVDGTARPRSGRAPGGLTSSDRTPRSIWPFGARVRAHVTFRVWTLRAARRVAQGAVRRVALRERA